MTRKQRCYELILALLFFSFNCGTFTAQGQGQGHFEGELIVKFLPDGRNVQLEAPYGYTDPEGRDWDVPAGMITDGASIPRVLWVIYPPFTGLYRQAAVIHDYYCETRTRPWKDTHLVFYNAMLTANVDSG